MLDGSEPPLNPSGREARGWLIGELAKPGYERKGILDRVLEWLDRLLGDAIGRGGDVSWIRLASVVLIAVLVVALVLLLISRLRRSPTMDAGSTEVFQQGLSAAEHRAAARAALAAGDHATAVVETFRALARAAVESGRLEDNPAATAHEVAGQLASAFPGESGPLLALGALFDEAAYGDRPITAAEATNAIALDDRLGARR